MLDEDEISAIQKRSKEFTGNDPELNGFAQKLDFLQKKLEEILKPYANKFDITTEMQDDAAKTIAEAFRDVDSDKALDGFAKVGEILRRTLSFETDAKGKKTPSTNFLDELGISNEEFAELLAKMLVLFNSQNPEDIEDFRSSVNPHFKKYLTLHPPPENNESLDE